MTQQDQPHLHHVVFAVAAERQAAMIDLFADLGFELQTAQLADLGVTVALVRDFLTGMDLGDTSDLGDTDVRVWIEGLPRSTDSATRLLDDLAR